MSGADVAGMANQIAAYFAAYPREEAVAGIADHIMKFWNPHMRRDLLAVAASKPATLHELVASALPKLA